MYVSFSSKYVGIIGLKIKGKTCTTYFNETNTTERLMSKYGSFDRELWISGTNKERVEREVLVF